MKNPAKTLLLLLPALPAGALTLGEAQAALFRDNADLAVLRLENERAESQWREARGALLPSIDALGNYSYTTETSRLQLDLPFPPPGGTHLDREIGDHDRVELGADASYALFTGFARGNNVAAKRANVLARAAQERAARNQMSLKLASLFYAWQLAQAQADFQAATALYARELQTQLEAFVRAGTAVRSRALGALARAKAAEVDQMAAENTRDSLAFEVLDFLGRRDSSAAASPNALAPDTATLPKPDWGAVPAASGGGTAEPSGGAEAENGSRRPELEAIAQNEAQARLGGRALLGQRFPQVYAMAGYRYANPGLNLAGDDYMGYGLLGVQLKWNLFDGARNSQQRKQLEIQERILEEQKRKLQGEWWKAMHSARLQYSRWEAQFAAARASREAAEAAATDLKRQFEAGVATGVDWLEARNNEAKARLMMEQARTMQRLALLQWRFAAGKELRF
jgi:outer membrane protein TolC